jgi:hypothetical protein
LRPIATNCDRLSLARYGDYPRKHRRALGALVPNWVNSGNHVRHPRFIPVIRF